MEKLFKCFKCSVYLYLFDQATLRHNYFKILKIQYLHIIKNVLWCTYLYACVHFVCKQGRHIHLSTRMLSPKVGSSCLLLLSTLWLETWLLTEPGAQWFIKLSFQRLPCFLVSSLPNARIIVCASTFNFGL